MNFLCPRQSEADFKPEVRPNNKASKPKTRSAWWERAEFIAVKWAANIHTLHPLPVSNNIILMGDDRLKSHLPDAAFITNLSRALPSPTVRISTKQPRWRPTDPDTCDKDGWGVATQRICIRPWKNVVFVQKMYSPIIKRVNIQLGSWRALTARLKRPLRKVFSSPPVAFLWLLYYFLLQSTSKAVYLVDVFVDSEPVIWVLSQFNVPKGGDRDWGFAFVLYSLVFWQQGPFWWTNSMLLFLPAGGIHRHRGSHNPNRQLEKDRKI